MNFGELVTAVQRQGGDSSGAIFTRADVLRWANEGQLLIVRKTECLQAHKDTSTQSSDGTYELPDDFLAMKRVTLNDILITQRSIEDLDALSQVIDQTGAGQGLYYYLWNRVLTIFPAPSTAGTNNLDIWYVKAPVVLVDDNDVPEIPTWMHKDLVQYCKVQAREIDDDLDGMTKLQNTFDMNLSETAYELQAQPVTSYPAIRSLPGDQY